MNDRAQQIAHNIAHVRECMAAAARRVGRDPEDVTLIAVTKTHAPRIVAMALAAGITDCGENRVQEAGEKIELLGSKNMRWHMIGQLQTNKAKPAAMLFNMLQSLDSVKLALELNKRVEQASLLGQRRLPVLLEVNVSGEVSKSGFALPGGLSNLDLLPQFFEAVEQIVALPQLDVQGLMTVAPYTDEPDEARPAFRTLRALRDELARRVPGASWLHLSMGMTNDFEVAIEEGATMVRVGRAIFGERKVEG